MFKIFSLITIFFLSISSSNCIIRENTNKHREILNYSRRAFSYIKIFNKDEELQAMGSGILIKNEAKASYVLTAGHICLMSDSPVKLTVTDIAGSEYKVKILKAIFNPLSAKETDICLLKTEKKIPFKPIRLAQKMPEWGAKVWNISAIADTFSPESNGLLLPVFSGYYAGHATEINRSIFTGIYVFGGSSGSMVLNEQGELVSMLVSFKRVYMMPLHEISNGIALKDIRNFLSLYMD